jgi:hypothetical protein
VQTSRAVLECAARSAQRETDSRPRCTHAIPPFFARSASTRECTRTAGKRVLIRSLRTSSLVSVMYPRDVLLMWAGASAKPDSATQRYAALRDAVVLHSTTQMGPSLQPATDDYSTLHSVT